jgi:hypothetical protein
MAVNLNSNHNVNETLGNKMEVSNALHSSIENRYNSIIWG